MIYKEVKHLTANRVLQILKSKRIYYENDSYPLDGIFTFDMIEQDFWFANKETIRDAIVQLSKDGMIAMFSNGRKYYDIKVILLPPGYDAAKEKKYVWMFFKSWKVKTTAVVSLIAATEPLTGLLRTAIKLLTQ
jgi:hypothetical protein